MQKTKQSDKPSNRQTKQAAEYCWLVALAWKYRLSPINTWLCSVHTISGIYLPGDQTEISPSIWAAILLQQRMAVFIWTTALCVKMQRLPSFQWDDCVYTAGVPPQRALATKQNKKKKKKNLAPLFLQRNVMMYGKVLRWLVKCMQSVCHLFLVDYFLTWAEYFCSLPTDSRGRG